MNTSKEDGGKINKILEKMRKFQDLIKTYEKHYYSIRKLAYFMKNSNQMTLKYHSRRRFIRSNEKCCSFV